LRLAPLRQHSPRSSTVQQNKQAYSTSVIRIPCLRPPYDVLQRRRQTIRCLSIKLSSSAALSLSLHLSHTSVPSTDNSTNAKQINSVAHETRQEHQPPPELFPTIPPTSLCRPLKDYSANYCVAPFDASHDHTPFATTTLLRSRKLSRKQARPTASAQHPKFRFPSPLYLFSRLTSPILNRAMAPPRGTRTHSHDKKAAKSGNPHIHARIQNDPANRGLPYLIPGSRPKRRAEH
jgi:hypothetical protein